MSKNGNRTFVLIVAAVVTLIVFNYIAIRTDKGTIGANKDPWMIFYFGSEFYWLQQFALGVDFHTYGAFSLSVFSRVLRKIGAFSIKNISTYSAILRSFGNPVSSFVYAPYLDFGYFGLSSKVSA